MPEILQLIDNAIDDATSDDAMRWTPEVTIEPYFEMFFMEDEHPTGGVGHVCNICGVSVDLGPCAEHCPSDVPGLTKVVCEANPPHFWWHPAGDYYDAPCFQCLYFEATKQAVIPCKHWPWRRWAVSRAVFGWLRALHVITGTGTVSGGPEGHRWCMTVSWNYPGRRAAIRRRNRRYVESVKS